MLKEVESYIGMLLFLLISKMFQFLGLSNNLKCLFSLCNFNSHLMLIGLASEGRGKNLSVT